MSIYQPKLSDFSAKIKDVYIELKDYEFFHYTTDGINSSSVFGS